jgi:hypothetical protein
VGQHHRKRISRGAPAGVDRLGQRRCRLFHFTDGVSWKYGSLPGFTVNYQGGTYGRPPTLRWPDDAKHGQWLISTLPLVGLNGSAQYLGDVAVSRSPDGLTWAKSHPHRQHLSRRQELDRMQ